MKRSLRITTLAALLALLMLLGSCGIASPKKLISKSYAYDSAPIYTSAEKLTSLSGAYASDGTYHSIVVFEDTNDAGYDEYKALSKLTGAIIGTWTDTAETEYYVTADVEDKSGNEIPLLEVVSRKVSQRSDKTYSLLSPNGETLLTFSDESILDDAVYRSEHLFIDGKVYKYDDDTGAFAHVADIGAFNSVPSGYFTVYHDMIYTKDNSDDVTVYDLTCAPIMRWEAPSYAYSTTRSPLSSGDILAQYLVELDENAKKYDIIYGSSKYELVTLLIDRESGKEKKINADYVFEDIMPIDAYSDHDSSYEAYAGKIDNLVTGYKIEDKRVDSSFEYILSLSDRGRVKAVISDGRSSSLASPVAPGLYSISEPMGGYTLLDSSFKKLGSFSASASYYGGYIVFSGKNEIYDSDLNVVHTLSDTQSIYGRFSNALMIKDTSAADSYILLTASGEKKDVPCTTAPKCENGYYYTVSTSNDGTGEYTYSYYNTNGEKLTSTHFALSEAFTGDGYMVLRGIDTERVWYIFKTSTAPKA